MSGPTIEEKNDLKQRYSAARAALAEINHKRAEAVKPFEADYRRLSGTLAEIEEETRGEIKHCLGCGSLILPGDKYCPSSDEGDCCEDCAYNLSDMVEYLKSVVECGHGDEWRSHDKAAQDLASMQDDIEKNGDRKLLYVKEGWS